jgi:hypothetical protein
MNPLNAAFDDLGVKKSVIDARRIAKISPGSSRYARAACRRAESPTLRGQWMPIRLRRKADQRLPHALWWRIDLEWTS